METVALVVVLVLAILVAGLMEGPDLEEHARWMQQLKEDGTWVMW